MARFKKHIALFLLLISSLFIVPKELLHELTFHTDTVDHGVITSANDFSLSTIHHHCDILEVFVQPYHAPDEAAPFAEITKIIAHYSFSFPSISFQVIDAFESRGPPEGIPAC